MQRSIRLLTLLVVFPLYNYGAAGSSPSSSSPIASRVGALFNNGLNRVYKIIDPYYPMVSEDYQTGPATVALLRNKEIAMELAFATNQPRTYINFVQDYVITTQLSDRAGPANRRIGEWLSSGNSEQLKACSECIYNFSPLFRLLLELYWSEHEAYRPATIEKDDFGVFESVNPFLSELEQPALELEAIIVRNRKILLEKSNESHISAAERKASKQLYPENFLLADIERPKHAAVYAIFQASVNLARINKQPPVATLVQQLAPLMHQIADREFYIRQVAITLLQSGAFDRMKDFYQIHGKNIPPVLAVMICDMLRATCRDAHDYLPHAYMDYYNTENTPAPAGIDPMLIKAANKFIFLLCNNLTPVERSNLYAASTEVLASRNKPAAIWAYVQYDETRRSLLTRIDETRKIPQLFERLAKFIPTTSFAPEHLSIVEDLSQQSAPSSSMSADTSVPHQHDIDSNHPSSAPITIDPAMPAQSIDSPQSLPKTQPSPQPQPNTPTRTSSTRGRGQRQ